MARPSCSRKEPNRLRSSGEMLRRLSIYKRAVGSDVDVACAESKRPKSVLEEEAKATVEACCRNRRLEDMARPLSLATSLNEAAVVERRKGFCMVNAYLRPLNIRPWFWS